MRKQDIRPTLEELDRELVELERRRRELDHAIGRVQRVAHWLRRRGADRQVATHAKPQRPSLSASCRAVLRMQAPGGLTPREMRDRLAAAGVDWGVYSNGQATLHTVLKRLVRQGEASVVVDESGHTRYAIRQVRTLAMTRREADDEDFTRRLLAEDDPEAIAALVRARRRRRQAT